MPNPEHQKAQELAALAGLRMREGDPATARRMYTEAADLEQKAFEKIPQDKTRTRSILGVSLASLLYKARELEAAERELYKLLTLEGLTTAAHRQLRDLLEVVWDEKALLDSGFQYGEGELLISLRGGEIGSGTAPLELIVQKTDGFKSLLYRVAEWTGQHPFRSRGRPPSEVFHALQLRATQPATGSYRFTVRFVEPAQQKLFEDQEISITATAVAESTVRILKLLNAAAVDELQEYIPQDDYRRAFTQLARNLAPTKRDAREIEVRQRSGRPDEVEESVILAIGSRAAINEVVRSSLHEDEKVTEVRGVLRALDLDQQWVDIQTDDGDRKHCKTPPEFLDDVVGPMVNRRVVAHGKSKRTKFLLRDIELDEEGDS